MTPSLTDPRVEFRGLIEADISKALNDPEVARLIAGYSANLSLHVVGQPRWPIEAVAMRLTREARTDAFN